MCEDLRPATTVVPRGLERELRAAAELLFRAPRPGGVRVDLRDSASNPAWLSTHVRSRGDLSQRFAVSLG